MVSIGFVASPSQTIAVRCQWDPCPNCHRGLGGKPQMLGDALVRCVAKKWNKIVVNMETTHHSNYYRSLSLSLSL